MSTHLKTAISYAQSNDHNSDDEIDDYFGISDKEAVQKLQHAILESIQSANEKILADNKKIQDITNLINAVLENPDKDNENLINDILHLCTFKSPTRGQFISVKGNVTMRI